MTEFVVEYWLEFLFATMIAIVGAWCKKLQAKLKKKQQEEELKKLQEDALREAVKAILHDMIFQLCEKYLALGYIPVDESEDVLERGRVLWKGYSGILGNSTGEDVYKKFKALPVKNPDTV